MSRLRRRRHPRAHAGAARARRAEKRADGRVKESSHVDLLLRTQAGAPHLRADATPAELAIVGEHWERLQRLHAEGTLLHAGRCEEHTGQPEDDGFALVIFTAESDQAAETLMRDDPCVRNGVMTAALHRYRVLLPLDQ